MFNRWKVDLDFDPCEYWQELARSEMSFLLNSGDVASIVGIDAWYKAEGRECVLEAAEKVADST